MTLKIITFCLHILVIASISEARRPYIKIDPKLVPLSAFNGTYIEIDHELVPREIENMNDMSPLPVPSGRSSAIKKYPVAKRKIQEIILEIEENKQSNNIHDNQHSKVGGTKLWKNETEIRKSNLKSVIGSEGEVYYDADWGLMSAVLTCYNNHWALRTGPEDWWTVVIRRIARAINDYGEVPQVREFFVEHEGKKKLEVIVGENLTNIDYNWLFSQFSDAIRENIKVPGYVDITENDFSSSTTEQIVISKIMLMSSVKNYFEFGVGTISCGIPGVEMKGTEQDWVKLVEKLDRLETLLAPITQHLHLTEWFSTTETVFNNLLDTYRGNPNIEWWVRILTWNERNGSGSRSHWSGWFPQFFGVDTWQPANYWDFPSDLVSVPLHFIDRSNYAEDDGILVAGIVGFNVEKGARAPIVEPTHAWSLLLPEESPIAERLLGGHIGV